MVQIRTVYLPTLGVSVDLRREGGSRWRFAGGGDMTARQLRATVLPPDAVKIVAYAMERPPGAPPPRARRKARTPRPSERPPVRAPKRP